VPVEDVLETCTLHAFERAREALRRIRRVEPEACFAGDLFGAAARFGGLAITGAELIRDELERNVERWEGTLARTDTPAQLVWGMGDPVSRADMVAYIREHAPRVAVHELAGVGHYPHYEVPERVAELVLSQA